VPKLLDARFVVLVGFQQCGHDRACVSVVASTRNCLVEPHSYRSAFTAGHTPNKTPTATEVAIDTWPLKSYRIPQYT
jgi:hypothetical protein